MRLGNTVEFTHVALGLIPEILNAIDVIVAVCEELRMKWSCFSEQVCV